MIYSITTSLPEKHGGRTQALLRRNLLLNEQLKKKVAILTTNYNANYHRIYEEYLNEGKITEQINIDNMYDWLSGYKLIKSPAKRANKEISVKTTPVEMKGYTHKINSKTHVVRYYNNGDYVLYRKYYAHSQVVKFEDYMSPIHKKRIERYHYNRYGQLHKQTVYSPVSWGRLCEKFYDTEGKLYCKKYYSREDKELTLIELFRGGDVYQTFNTENELIAFYFDHLLKKNAIVFNDARALDIPLLSKKVNTKNILFFHNSHQAVNKDYKSYEYSLTHPAQVSRYIVLTEAQKQDIIKSYDIVPSQIQVIPHYFNKLSLNNEEEDERHSFVYIGRFNAQKQLTHLLNAYQLFLEKGHNVKLKLYGPSEPKELKKVQETLNQFNISEMVEIHDYIDEPAPIFKKAKASLLTSKFEGFGLSIGESISNGCPVIAYNVNYGPSEMISDGENGLLVEPDNIQCFAEKMERLINKPLKHVSLSPHLAKEAAITNFKSLLKTVRKAR
ncbi:glycosyltransferase [Staphylococcus sp. SQ8-PEA]|uniref:Glycosyltransferase n=1 Tax=Staphylococcus marylandisciuri TaxID=2981529 RepID=A0ABT2QN08_9STAP|nr:glycosyltransferase [Staphylococcus marylandisciuri]MCU5745346.1 glycosyltransferase [Staphylococcus marylandisciuri]